MNGYVPPTKQYFDKQIPEEDDEFKISNETHKKHEKLDKIFEQYFDYDTISTAKVKNKIL